MKDVQPGLALAGSAFSFKDRLLSVVQLAMARFQDESFTSLLQLFVRRAQGRLQPALRAARCLECLCRVFHPERVVSGLPGAHAKGLGPQQRQRPLWRAPDFRRPANAQSAGPDWPRASKAAVHRYRGADAPLGPTANVPGTGRFADRPEWHAVFSPTAIGCPGCFGRPLRNGQTEHFHVVLTPVVVPGQVAVFPLPPAFLVPQDGHDKQDCELAAGARWLAKWASRVAQWGETTFLGSDLYCHQPAFSSMRAPSYPRASRTLSTCACWRSTSHSKAGTRCWTFCSKA